MLDYNNPIDQDVMSVMGMAPQADLGAYQGDPMQEKKLQFMYELARMNPNNSSFANNYLNEYMGYMYPQPKSMFQQYLEQQMMGSQGGAMMQGGVPQQPQLGAFDPNEFIIEVPDQSAQMQPQMQQPAAPNFEDWGALTANTSPINKSINPSYQGFAIGNTLPKGYS